MSQLRRSDAGTLVKAAADSVDPMKIGSVRKKIQRLCRSLMVLWWAASEELQNAGAAVRRAIVGWNQRISVAEVHPLFTEDNGELATPPLGWALRVPVKCHVRFRELLPRMQGS
ncbi:hypothetical protein Poly24_23840 [Rosistilla carotiformis]|uniref:Uncharacterized protein n=1 Tax=Rosistilla carotiformis TaxID=2528017 RepID=A0A518JT01_9BACT|nr:hypothetical protein Poly24_23840 [Rosistilla carotiformis]